MSQLDTLPAPLSRPAQAYPSDLRTLKVTGTVTVAYVVEADGSVSQVRPVAISLQSGRKKRLDPGMEEEAEAYAVADARLWSFSPGRKDGRAVAARLSTMVRFAP